MNKYYHWDIEIEDSYQDILDSDNQADKARREVFMSKILRNINDDFAPKLKMLDHYLFTSDTQTAATNEHNKKMRQNAFRKQFKRELKNIAQMLPNNHPLKMRINSL
jgi:hypothetical protein